MSKQVTLSIDGQRIRYTPDGRVAVLDAIGALYDFGDSRKVWRKLTSQWPKLSDECSAYRFSSEEATPVTTHSGWEEIETHLLDYLIDDRLGAGSRLTGRGHRPKVVMFH